MQKNSLPNQNLPQLYRFCFLMLGDAARAQEVFEAIMHDAALRAAQGELPKDRLWMFNDARWRCLEISETPPPVQVDLVYLCFPNNPTGAVMTREQLVQWVRYARDNGAIILYDAAYEAYISDPGIPHSIFEIPEARECAIEFRSFSKTGGFTGVRCGFTVMPKSLTAKKKDGEKLPLHPLWHRRWSTKANSVSYPVQRGAEAIYSDNGRRQVRELVNHYMTNARILSEGARHAGLCVFGGTNAPYIWVRTPENTTSWAMFDHMLRDLNIVITPGSGFGAQGEGYIRISAFNSRDNAEEAARRLRSLAAKSASAA